jgi:hypothetical protein
MLRVTLFALGVTLLVTPGVVRLVLPGEVRVAGLTG